MASQYLGSFETGVSDLLSTLTSVPTTLMNNFPHLLVFAATEYVEDWGYSLIPGFMGRSYFLSGARKVVDAKIGKSVH